MKFSLLMFLLTFEKKRTKENKRKEKNKESK